MTVAELIVSLSALPQTAKVYMADQESRHGVFDADWEVEHVGLIPSGDGVLLIWCGGSSVCPFCRESRMLNS